MLLVLSRGSLMPVALFMSVWLTGWSFGVYALVSSVIRAWKSVREAGVLGAGQAGFLTIFTIPFVAGECIGLGVLVWACGVAAFGIIAGTIGMNVLFHHLLKAPTLAGRALMDRVEGFKMFLTAVDSDRLQTVARPDKTPQLFERFLPYAFALGVGHAWAEQFSQVLAQAAAAGGSGTGTGYSPSWYSGASFGSFSAMTFTSSFSSSFSSAISSSSTAPDRLQGREAGVRPVAVGVAVVAAVGKNAGQRATATSKTNCDRGHSPETYLRGYLCFVEVAMKFTRVLFGIFALLLSGATITLVSQEKASQEKHSPRPVGYTYAPTSEQTVRGWVEESKDFQCPVTGTVGSHITVKNESGSVEVHLAPASFMKQYELT